MKQERDAERDKRLAKKQAERTAAPEKRAKIEKVSHRLSALFGMNDKPHERGKQLEAILNDLFRIYGILVCEDFRRKDPDTAIVVEQIDGVIELNEEIHLVEMKWLKEPVGMVPMLAARIRHAVTLPRRSCRTPTGKVTSCHRRQKSFPKNPVIEKSRRKIQTKSKKHGNSDTNACLSFRRKRWIVEPAANLDSSLAFFGMVSSLYPSFCNT